MFRRSYDVKKRFELLSKVVFEILPKNRVYKVVGRLEAILYVKNNLRELLESFLHALRPYELDFWEVLQTQPLGALRIVSGRLMTL